MVKKVFLIIVLITVNLLSVFPQNREQVIKEDVPFDSIRLSDPFILADKNTSMYYMTGTGGMMWKSKDLKKWSGPVKVAKTDSSSWVLIVCPEPHRLSPIRRNAF